MTELDTAQIALSLYALMARDPLDAIDMLNETDNVEALELLHKMLITKGSERTDHELNDIMAGPVLRRLERLR